MKLATSTADFDYCASNIYEALDCFDGTGFTYIDINFSSHYFNGLLLEDNCAEEFKRIREYADRKGYTFIQSHAPWDGNPIVKNEKYDDFVIRMHHTIEACGILGVPTTVTHSGMDGHISMDEYFERNVEFYRMFYEDAERNKVYVLIENSMPGNMGNNTFFFYGREMREFLDYAAHPYLGACWDTGHANTFTDQYQNITDLGKYLKAIHVHDNMGTCDEHLAPYQGCINLDELMCALLDNKFEGPFTLEADNIVRFSDAWPISRKQFDLPGGRIARLAKPSKKIKIKAEELLYEIGKYVLEEYDCFEE